MGIRAVVFLASCSAAFGQVWPLDTLQGLKMHKVNAEVVTYRGERAVKVTEAAGLPASDDDDRLVVIETSDFKDGAIEISVAGEPAPGAGEGARGFVGVAFRISADESRFECFYLRPTNGRAEDQERRNHSVQYISSPEFPWFRLRKEAPSKYESYVDLVPGEWTKLRIEVRGDTARLFVHSQPQPSLIVNDLKHGFSTGRIGLWIGPGTLAHFTKLRVTAE
jgi:hypothetical protein